MSQKRKRYRLRALQLKEVSLVPAGANQHAHRLFVKEAATPDTAAWWETYRAQRAGLTARAVELAKAQPADLSIQLADSALRFLENLEGLAKQTGAPAPEHLSALDAALVALGDKAAESGTWAFKDFEGALCAFENAAGAPAASPPPAPGAALEEATMEKKLMELLKGLEGDKQTAAVTELVKGLSTTQAVALLKALMAECPECGKVFDAESHKAAAAEQAKEAALPPEVRKELDAARAERAKAEETRAQLNKEMEDFKDKQRLTELVAKAANINAPGVTTAEVASTLQVLEKTAPALLPVVEKALAAGATAHSKYLELMAQDRGSGHAPPVATSAQGKLNAKAAELRKADPKLDEPTAIALAMDADPELATAAMAEERREGLTRAGMV